MSAWDDAAWFGGLEDELRRETADLEYAAAIASAKPSGASSPSVAATAASTPAASASAGAPSASSGPPPAPQETAPAKKALRQGTSCHSLVIHPDGLKTIKHGLLTTSRCRREVKAAMAIALERLGAIAVVCEEQHADVRHKGDSIWHQHGGFQLLEEMPLVSFCAELRRHFQDALAELDADQAAKEAAAQKKLAAKRKEAGKKGHEALRRKREKAATKRANYKRAAQERAAKRRRKSVEAAAAAAGAGGGGQSFAGGFYSPARTDGGQTCGFGDDLDSQSLFGGVSAASVGFGDDFDSRSLLGGASAASSDIGAASLASASVGFGAGSSTAGAGSVHFGGLGSGLTASGADTPHSDMPDWAQQSVLGSATADGSQTLSLHEQLDPGGVAGAGAGQAADASDSKEGAAADKAGVPETDAEQVVIYFTPRRLETSAGYLLGAAGFKSKQRDEEPVIVGTTLLDLSILCKELPKPTLAGSIFRALEAQFKGGCCTLGGALLAAESSGPLVAYGDRINAQFVTNYNERQRAKAAEIERQREEAVDLASVKPTMWAAGSHVNAGIAMAGIANACAKLPCELKREWPTGDLKDGDARTVTLCAFGYCYRRFLEHSPENEFAAECLCQSITDPSPGKRDADTGRCGVTVHTGRSGSGKSSYGAYCVRDTLLLAGERGASFDFLASSSIAHLCTYHPPAGSSAKDTGGAGGSPKAEAEQTPLDPLNLEKRRALGRYVVQEEMSEVGPRHAGQLKELLAGDITSVSEARNLLKDASGSRSLSIHPRPTIANTAEPGGPRLPTKSEQDQFKSRFSICPISRPPAQEGDPWFGRAEVCPMCFWATNIGLLTRKTGTENAVRLRIRARAREQLRIPDQDEEERDFLEQLVRMPAAK